METLIIGAGDVGSNIARNLSDSHNLTVIDRDADRIDTLTTEVDVTGVVGDGRSLPVLRDSGLETAALVIATTDDDATNLMVCTAVKNSQETHTIARVKDVGLFRVWEQSEKQFGVDTMLCVDLLAAQILVRTVALPGAKAFDTFGEGIAEVAEFPIDESTPITNRTVAEADQHPSLTFAGIVRDGDVLIPKGETVFRAGDSVIVIGSHSGISRFAAEVSDRPAPTPDDELLIIGGTAVGYQIARLIEDRELSTRIVESDSERAAWLRDHLESTTVIEADPSDIETFGLDNLSTADFVIGAMESDDTNYLIGQFAGEFGSAQTAAVVDQPEVIDIFEESELDLIFHPQDIITGEILQQVYHQRAESVSVIEHDAAEVLEIVVDRDSILAGDSLMDVARHLPSEFVIGAIVGVVRFEHLVAARLSRPVTG
ncbi:Trk system potassium transporter TrkA [Halohasta litorea]|uniref:Trk system potassium transporter TrkA n=1 Tax=Halohasta litorea TaxID=869891 RepID=A0ABD6DC21_9EURY|nr:Trk system potassium transporter TrkA [Halohasta litorea]